MLQPFALQLYRLPHCRTLVLCPQHLPTATAPAGIYFSLSLPIKSHVKFMEKVGNSRWGEKRGEPFPLKKERGPVWQEKEKGEGTWVGLGVI